jgi:hypothetical protein
MIESLVIWNVPFLGKVKIGFAKTESSSIRTTDCRAGEIAIKATGMDGKQSLDRISVDRNCVFSVDRKF